MHKHLMPEPLNLVQNVLDDLYLFFQALQEQGVIHDFLRLSNGYEFVTNDGLQKLSVSLTDLAPSEARVINAQYGIPQAEDEA